MRPWWQVGLDGDRRTLSVTAAARLSGTRVGLSTKTAWMSFIAGDATDRKQILLTPQDIDAHHGYSFSSRLDDSDRQAVIIQMPDSEEEFRKVVSDVFTGIRSELQPRAVDEFMAHVSVPDRIVMISLDPNSGGAKGFIIYDRKMAIGDQSIHLDTVVRALATSDDDNHLPALLAAYHAQHVVDYETLIYSNLQADQLPPIYMDTTVTEGMEETHPMFCELDELAWNDCFDPAFGPVPKDYIHEKVGASDLPEMIMPPKRI